MLKSLCQCYVDHEAWPVQMGLGFSMIWSQITGWKLFKYHMYFTLLHFRLSEAVVEVNEKLVDKEAGVKVNQGLTTT